MNPPYGERISTPNLLNTYKMIGERFKKAFAGNEAWVLSYREECFEQIGLKPSIKIPVFNGSLECEFRKYVMFDGKMKDFRSEGGIVKTEREKSEMAQKHRFKKEREFKKRVSEETETRRTISVLSSSILTVWKTSRRSVLSSIRAVVHVSVAVDAMMTTMTSVAAAASRATARVAVTSVASATESVSRKATSVVAEISEASAEARRTSALTSTTRIKDISTHASCFTTHGW